ncbi:unnamed protein product [Paramecium sonneborni]|uniref:Uncharacterized protein n=1 Tax=Paramecium sonneborni TaxID=65129 RepID=A0A8S1KPA8_9CILI|nr:unnamed protein product [Paramecium sonneborni]
MHADSFLNNKYSSFNRSLCKIKSYSFQHYSTHKVRPNFKLKIINNDVIMVNQYNQSPKNIQNNNLFSQPITKQSLLKSD